MEQAKHIERRLFALGTIGVGLMLLVVACAPATGARSPWFGTATMGTASSQPGDAFATNILVHLGYTRDITTLDITVTGPNEYVRTESITSARSRVSMQELHSRDGGPLVSGTYAIHVRGSGGDETWTIDFDATEVLAPTNVTVVSATTAAVEVVWDLVPRARAYEVTLMERTGPTTAQSIPPTAVLNDPSEGRHAFTGLDLRVDGEYHVNLLALDSIDRNDPNGPPRQVNTVHQSSPEFTPAAPD